VAADRRLAACHLLLGVTRRRDSDRIGIWGTSYAVAVPALEREFDADERAQLAGEPPAPRALVSDDPAAMPAF